MAFLQQVSESICFAFKSAAFPEMIDGMVWRLIYDRKTFRFICSQAMMMMMMMMLMMLMMMMLKMMMMMVVVVV